MASGVDLVKYPEHIQSALVAAQLDNDLAEYYKLLTTVHAVTGNVSKANDCLIRFAEHAVPEMAVAKEHRDRAMQKELEDMDKWVLKIDTASLPRENKGLIRRRKPVDLRPESVQVRKTRSRTREE